MRSRCASSSLPWRSSSASRSASSASMPADGPLHALRAGDVVGRREDVHLVLLVHDLTGQRVQRVDPLDLVAEELDPDRELLVHRDDLDGVAADPERAAGEGEVVAGVLHLHEPAQQVVALDDVADLQRRHPVDVLLRRAQAVDAGDRRHHDHVPAGQQRVGRRVPQPLDLVVDRGVLLDVGVRLRDVRLGLVVVVVRDEVLDRVVRQELAELVGQLRGQGLVRRHHQRRTLQLLDQPGRRRRLAGAGGAEQHDVLLARPDPAGQVVDRRGLVAGGRELGDHLERGDPALQVGGGSHGVNRRRGHRQPATARSAGRLPTRRPRPVQRPAHRLRPTTAPWPRRTRRCVAGRGRAAAACSRSRRPAPSASARHQSRSSSAVRQPGPSTSRTCRWTARPGRRRRGTACARPPGPRVDLRATTVVLVAPGHRREARRAQRRRRSRPRRPATGPRAAGRAPVLGGEPGHRGRADVLGAAAAARRRPGRIRCSQPGGLRRPGAGRTARAGASCGRRTRRPRAHVALEGQQPSLPQRPELAASSRRAAGRCPARRRRRPAAAPSLGLGRDAGPRLGLASSPGCRQAARPAPARGRARPAPGGTAHPSASRRSAGRRARRSRRAGPRRAPRRCAGRPAGG